MQTNGAPPFPVGADVYTRRLWVYLSLLIVAILCGLLWDRILVTIPAGHYGVMYRRFGQGTVTDQPFGEGLYVIAPWNKLTAYETRLQARTVTLKVPSSEGLELSVSLVLRYRPFIESLGHLHRDIGPEYFERLILPEVHEHVRKVLGTRRAQDISVGDRQLLEELAHLPVLGRLHRERRKDAPPASPYVLLEELRTLDIVRPQHVVDAISEKLRQEQLALEYQHRLQREQEEAQRKRVEATGIRDYNRIAGPIQPDLLRWRSIDAALELARSNNSKVVVLGGQLGTPLMLNVDSGADSNPPPNVRGPAPHKSPAGETAAGEKRVR